MHRLNPPNASALKSELRGCHAPNHRASNLHFGLDTRRLRYRRLLCYHSICVVPLGVPHSPVARRLLENGSYPRVPHQSCAFAASSTLPRDHRDQRMRAVATSAQVILGGQPLARREQSAKDTNCTSHEQNAPNQSYQFTSRF